ncbi:uncharacterized protein LOC106666683 [Cimex lectularius]|uniref:Uncharacterized protein n=1 Tax=Cimex lectularius TaxID=79782 RepID=A0A8I6RN16_CIMLE|nr:uncharacterized protein LOC106666683 [Cimex lectularius]
MLSKQAVGTTAVTTDDPTTVYTTLQNQQFQETTNPSVDDYNVTSTAATSEEEERRSTNKLQPNAESLSTFVFEVDADHDGNLQDIDTEESKMLHNLFIHFDPRKYSEVQPEQKSEQDDHETAGSAVHITSYIADSETSKPMSMETGLMSIKNKTEGADMISAFFVAPDDEVNEIDKKKYNGRPIVVTNLRDDLIREERYSGQESKSLTNNILAPIRAAVSLSQDKEEPMIEKQEIHEEPVYKTFIDIQKSIPYELKEIEHKEQPLNNDILHQMNYQRPQIRNPLYYRYPMYYIPQSYIGNYIMRHSHENTGFRYIRPAFIPLQYYLRYHQMPQVQPVAHIPQVYSGIILGNPYYLQDQTGETGYETDQNVLQSVQTENKINFQVQPQQQHQQTHHLPPFRPSHPVFTSQYPPYTYRVLSTMRGRGARSATNKQLCIEYGGFKPPMVPSLQIEEGQEEDSAQEKSSEEDSSEDN